LAELVVQPENANYRVIRIAQNLLFIFRTPNPGIEGIWPNISQQYSAVQIDALDECAVGLHKSEIIHQNDLIYSLEFVSLEFAF
jgi:hypothetical protein